jgi:hypothetical protein
LRTDRLNRIVGYALSRHEAYLIVLVTFVAVMVSILRGWPVWVVAACLVGGVVLMVLLVADSLADPAVEQEASMADLEVGRVTDKALRASVLKAMEYVRGVHQLVRRDREGLLTSARDELPQMEQAVRSLYQMALRVQEYRADTLIQRDLADLRAEASRTRNVSSSRQEQLASLEKLESLIRSAEQEIQAAVAQLGQSYAEIKAISVTPELRGQSIAALEDLHQSTERLSDLAHGYDEVFGQRTAASGPERQA